ncbi:MAG: DNA methyltransferase, partial [Armatimonadetes bacterium]|nr:DNA methyltransferase [Armatimonadota bacterium]
LVPVARLTRAEGKPYHTIINADNYHALQLLLYCYAGQVDVIYIDPPYNTGARDWKYNNHFVDAADQWRHSKWLAMMKKRLLLAKRLLRGNGVLIVTIDENEVLHLGLLLREIFAESEQQLATIVSNPGGSFGGNLSSVNEYAFFVVPRGLDVVKGRPVEQPEPGLFPEGETFVLERLRKRGDGSLREDRKNMFYPVYVDKTTHQPKFVGEVVPFGKAPCMEEVDGCVPVFPIDEKGIERRWNFGRETMMTMIGLERIAAKADRNGVVKLFQKKPPKVIRRMNTVWTASEYAAGDYGSRLVNAIFGRPNAFPFPKSVYAVRDCIGAVCVDRPEALVLDFFAGSGTTYHATALLNAEDGGNRRCILVTNNEVAEKQAKQLNAEGLFPGDADFEKQGICESVTWPRCKFVTQGHRDDGTPLPGEYLGGGEMKDGFKENLEYFRLDFLDRHEVAYGDRFEAILPILWLMAGSRGEPETVRGRGKWFIPKHSPYAVLIQEQHFAEFKRELKGRPDVAVVFLVTDSEEAFREMSGNLPGGPRTKMLYKDYLDNFSLNTEKSL